ARRGDARRGNTRDQVTASLSGAYSAGGQMRGLAGNEDLSKTQRRRASSSSAKFEANPKKLYDRAEKIDAKLDKAKKKAEQLQGISDSVSGSQIGRAHV